MTCEDCIHSEVCCSFLIADEDFEITNPDKMANSCDDFADRSRLVESPKVGDCVYQLYPLNTVGDYGISKLRVTGIIIDTDGVAFDKELIGKQFFFY